MTVRPVVPPSDYAARANAFIETKGLAFSGSFLVALDGQIILRGAKGFANAQFCVENQANTRFRIGSVTKQFTAAAILMLAETGQLTLDDLIVRYIPNPRGDWSGITIRMLLNHRAGIPSYTNLETFAAEFSKIDRTPAEVIELIAPMPLDFAPGTDNRYSNSGYTILGRIIELIADTSYAEYLAEHIFVPLDMKNTGYEDGHTVIRDLASGYVFDRGQLANAPFISMQLPFAAGGLYSNVDDLLIWQRALYDGCLLSEGARREMMRDYGDGQGLGIMLVQSPRKVIQHGGGINGFLSWLARLLDERIDVIVLCNNGCVDATIRADPVSIANGLIALMLGLPIDAAVF